MELRIMAFKGSPWQIGNTHEAVLEVRGRNADPDKLLGAHIVWRTRTGRVVRGKVVHRHGHLTGKKVVARFHKGLPGDALGGTVEVRAAAETKSVKRTSKPAKAPEGRVQARRKATKDAVVATPKRRKKKD